jgi:hypothetical protein
MNFKVQEASSFLVWTVCFYSRSWSTEGQKDRRLAAGNFALMLVNIMWEIQ